MSSSTSHTTIRKTQVSQRPPAPRHAEAERSRGAPADVWSPASGASSAKRSLCGLCSTVDRRPISTSGPLLSRSAIGNSHSAHMTRCSEGDSGNLIPAGTSDPTCGDAYLSHEHAQNTDSDLGRL